MSARQDAASRSEATGARVRLPLQIGLGGLGQTTRYAALVWWGPALLLLDAIMAPAFRPALGFVWIMGVGLLGIFAFAFALEAADRARRDRPSDIVLTAAGLEIEPSAGAIRKLAWSDVDAARCEIIDGEGRLAVRWLALSLLTLRRVPSLVARARVPTYELRLPLRKASDDDVLLASGEGDERESLAALRDSIRSAATSPDDAPKTAARDLPPEVLRCPACEAPQAPVDRASAPCPFCAQEVSMPEALRQKLRAAAELEAHDAPTDRLVESLVSQPGARAAGRGIWLGRKLLVLIQPAAFVYLCVLLFGAGLRGHASDVSIKRLAPSDELVALYDLGVIALLVATVFVAVWCTLSAYLANRRALRVLAEHFGAVPPLEPGAPYACRQCGAPLPTPSKAAMLVRCVYCRAQNVLGIDPRPAASRRRQERMDIAAAVRHRRRARVRFAITLPVCVIAGALAVREARLLWWIPPWDKPSMSYGGRAGTIENRDLIRRTVTITLAETHIPVRATVVPRGTVEWWCPYSCTIEVGKTRFSPPKRADVKILIDHGRLQPQKDPSP